MIKKQGIALNIVSMLLLHTLCCGLPLILSLGGSFALYFTLKSYTSWVLVFYIVSTLYSVYYLYNNKSNQISQIKLKRVIFILFTALTFGMYLYFHTNAFKTEEEVMKQKHIERVLNRKTK